ncbi:MAG: class I SAM-dependent methyltransferase [Dehalococcoidia bacterium]
MEDFYDILRTSKRTVRKILDLGCGDGRSLIELAKHGFEVIGIDLVGKKSVERRAEKEGVTVHFVEADITLYPFENEKYDAIIVSEVLHLLSRNSAEDIINRVIKSTNDRGFVYVSILSNLRRKIVATGEEFGYQDQSDYSSDEANRLLKGKFANWNIIDLVTFHDEGDWPVSPGKHPIEPYHWSSDYVCMIAQK